MECSFHVVFGLHEVVN